MRGYFGSVGAVLGFLSVAGGAFGAHFLKSILTPEQLAIFETAIRYQMYHALALLVIGRAIDRTPNVWLHSAGWSMLAGVVLFSGSLYMVAFSGVRWVGAITPLGGAALLAGWALVARGVWKPRATRL